MTDDERQELKDRLIMAQIEKLAFDTDLARRQERWDVRKFIVTTALTALVSLAAAVGAGVAIGNYYARAPAQQITFPPGTTITVPATH